MTTPDPQRVELLPCPFCGGEGDLIRNGPSDKQIALAYLDGECPEDNRYYVRCMVCEAAGPEWIVRADAVDRWNARALSAADAIQPPQRDEVLTVDVIHVQSLARRLDDLAAEVRRVTTGVTQRSPTALRGACIKTAVQLNDEARFLRALATTTDGAGADRG